MKEDHIPPRIKVVTARGPAALEKAIQQVMCEEVVLNFTFTEVLDKLNEHHYTVVFRIFNTEPIEDTWE